MKLYTYSQAREKLAVLLEEAKSKEVVIRRRNGDQFTIRPRQPRKSPFYVPPISTKVTTQDIVEAIREGREGAGR